MTDLCIAPAQSRRKIFWTTQPDPCGVDVICGHECGHPGLKYLFPSAPDAPCALPCHDATQDPDCLAQARNDYYRTGLSISNEDWLRGIVINMLMTDGRAPNAPCGYRPGAQGGHWSESFREDGLPVGTLMRSVDARGTIREQVQLITSFAQATLARLVTLGVVSSLDVKGSYLGSNRVRLDVEYTAPMGLTGRVGFAATRLENSWVFA